MSAYEFKKPISKKNIYDSQLLLRRVMMQNLEKRILQEAKLTGDEAFIMCAMRKKYEYGLVKKALIESKREYLKQFVDTNIAIHAMTNMNNITD